MTEDFVNAVNNIQKMDQRSIDNAKDIARLQMKVDLLFKFVEARITADMDLLKIIREAIDEAKNHEATP